MFQETAVKEERAPEPTVDSLVHGIWKVSGAGRMESVGRGVQLKAVGQVGGGKGCGCTVNRG